MLAHHKQGALPVFDGVFGFGKLSAGWHGQGQQGSCGSRKNKYFHGVSYFFTLKKIAWYIYLN
jgi:hypothetical protein